MVAALAGCHTKLAGPADPGGPAAASAAGLLPIAAGTYVEQGQGCENPPAVFHYDGRGMGWTGRGGNGAALYPIRRVREEPGLWVATIVAPGPGASGASEPRELDVHIVPRGPGRVMVRAMQRVEMELCAPDRLPWWALR